MRHWYNIWFHILCKYQSLLEYSSLINVAMPIMFALIVHTSVVNFNGKIIFKTGTMLYSSKFADLHKGCCPVTLAKEFRAPCPPENDLTERPHCWRVRHWFQWGGGGSHVKAYGDVPPKWVTFSPKILRHESQFGFKKNNKKKSLQEGPFSQKLRKTCKISRFWKTLRTWVPTCENLGENRQTNKQINKNKYKNKKQKQTNQPFLRGKNP